VLPVAIGATLSFTLGFGICKLLFSPHDINLKIHRENKEIIAERNEVLEQLLDETIIKKKIPFVKSSVDEVIDFYNNDYCPFSQRAWITVLEKNLKMNYHLVDLNNKTEQFLKVNPKGEVPAASHNGKNLYESEELCLYLDQTFHNDNPLTPEDAYENFRMKILYKKYSQVISKFYALLKEQDSDKHKDMLTNLENLIKELDGDIKGPYILGIQFSLIDIFLIPFFERIEVVLGHFRGFNIPEDCVNVKTWLRNCYARDSFKTTAARRTGESMMKIPFRERERNDYLIEVYTAYAFDKVPEIKKALAGAKAPLSKQEWEAIIKS